MAGNYAQLLDIINNPTNHSLPAWDNDNKLIEGLTIKQYLLTIINSLTVGYQFMGVATPSTSPGTPDQNVFYLAAMAGTYTNFGGIILADGEFAVLKYNGSWTKDVTGAATSEAVNYLRQNMANGANLFNKDWEKKVYNYDVNPTDLITDKIIQNVQLTSTAGFYVDVLSSVSPYIEIEPYKNYAINWSVSNNRKMFVFDSNLQIIQSYYSVSGYFTAPQNAKYVRFAFDTASTNSIIINRGTTVDTNATYYGKSASEVEFKELKDDVKLLNKKVVPILSTNTTINSFISELYADFSKQNTYTAADVNGIRLHRGTNDNDWYIFLLKGQVIITGNHIYGKEYQNEPFKVSRNNIDLYAVIDWTNVPTTSTDYSVTFYSVDSLNGNPNISAYIQAEKINSSLNKLVNPNPFVIKSIVDNSVQISDGLSLTSASAPQLAFDKSSGLLGCVTQAAWLQYGETYQQVRLDIFPVTQPTNVRHINIGSGADEVNVLSLGNRVWRVMYKYPDVWKYKDYHYDTNTLDEEVEIKFNNNGTLVSLANWNRVAYLSELGYTDNGVATIITSSLYKDSDGKIWGCWTTNEGYPIVFYSEDNMATIIPYSVFPQTCQYEASVCWMGERLHFVGRVNNVVAYSDDNGENWTITPVTGGDQRPRIYNYNDEKIIWIIANYRGTLKINIGTTLYEDSTVFCELPLTYGCVYPSLFIWDGTIYCVYGSSPLRLDYYNNNPPTTWGKDIVSFIRLGKF